MQSLPICLRQATTNDLGLIHQAWIRSHYKLGFSSKGIPSQIYYSEQQKLISKILSDESTQVLCAAPIDDDLTVLGFVVFDNAYYNHGLLHYCYVKDAFRRAGIGKMLIEAASATMSPHKPIYVTHLSELGRHVIGRALYNPYILAELQDADETPVSPIRVEYISQ